MNSRQESDLSGTTSIPAPTNGLFQLTNTYLPGQADRIGDWLDRHSVYQPDFLTDFVIILYECARSDVAPDQIIDVMRRFADDPAAFSVPGAGRPQD